jgi:hypothetical protein
MLEMIRDRLAVSPFVADPRGRVISPAALAARRPPEFATGSRRPVRIGRCRHCRLPEEAKRRPLRRRPARWSTRRRRISNTVNRGERGTRRQEGRSGRTLASGELLMIQDEFPVTSPPGRGGPATPGGVAERRATKTAMTSTGKFRHP